MKVTEKKIDEIHLDPSNVRVHDQKNLKAIAASLARFGQQKPIVLDKNDIVRAGNGTLEAAKALGWEKINVVYSGLDSNELTAYAIADNRTAELAEWDQEGLSLQLEELGKELADIAYEDFKINTDDNDEESPPKENEAMIVITCESEAQQEALFKEFMERNLQCKII